MADDNNNVIISRIQNRRGLKQDLPQPLRPGEIGFALDTRQVFIGADPSDATSGGYNKVSVFETTTNAKDITISIANNQIIAFTVPFKKFPRGTFDGITNTANWNPTSNTYTSSGVPVFSDNITGGAENATSITSIVTNSAFTASDATNNGILVLKNGTLLVGDAVNSTPASNADYSFAASRDSSNTHILTLRTAPLASDEIAVCYYSNTAVIQALSNATIVYPGSTIQSFYTAYNIPSYRQIPTELVTVSTTTGQGLIGLEYKHIAVTADSRDNIVSPTALTLGNLLVSRSDELASTTTTVDSANGTITFDVAAGHDYDANGAFSYVFVTNPDDANVYLHNKLFQLTGNASTTITVDIPSNAAVTAREVTATVQTGSLSNIVLTGNVEGVLSGSNVYLLGDSANSAIVDTLYPVVSANATAFIVDITDNSNFDANVDTDISFINYSAGGDVILYSINHGYPEDTFLDIADSSNVTQLPNTSYQVNTVTSNTFVLSSSTGITEAITCNISPTLANTYLTNYVTPVRSIDLSGDTTINDVVATVNDISDWPSLNLLPGSTSRVYLTHRNAYSSVGFNFRVHDDPVTPTASVLKLEDIEYTVDTTVKAKLERWMNTILDSDDVNLFTSVMVGAGYAASGTENLTDYILDIDNTFDEITFNSREEARDFNKTVNALYFEKTSTDIKGLVNLKTNIELQTRTAAVVGDKTVSYTEMNTATIPASGGNINSMTQSISVYNTYLIDYTVTEASSVTSAGENYQRMGTMFVSARSDFDGGNGDVLFRDVSSEMVDTALTGNVVFSASLVDNSIIFNAVNSVNRDLSVKYLVKRWSSDPV